jgi:hypothetical protein
VVLPRVILEPPLEWRVQERKYIQEVVIEADLKTYKKL